MVTAAAAGVSPREFYRMTLGEILVVLEGYHRARRNAVVDRIVACVRALGQAFGKADALQGLVEGGGQQISAHGAKLARLWRPSHGD
jgi:hypothetical protein